MIAILLAAGYATRLYPLTKEYPKALLEAGDMPIIDHIVLRLQELKDCKRILVATNSKFIGFFRDWQAQRHWRIPVEIIDNKTYRNEERRGAVGDLAFAIKSRRVKDDILVIGADNLFNARLGRFWDFCQRRNVFPVVGLYDVKRPSLARRYGVVRIKNTGEIIAFYEKSKNPPTTLAAMCLYYFPAGTIHFIFKYLKEENAPDVIGLYIAWLLRHIKVYGHRFQGKWFDIGDKQVYKQAQDNF